MATSLTPPVTSSEVPEAPSLSPAQLFEVTRARESVSNHSNAVDRALKELTMAEIRTAEMLMAEDAAAAVKELLGVLQSVGQTIDEIRTNLRKLGNAGV